MKAQKVRFVVECVTLTLKSTGKFARFTGIEAMTDIPRHKDKSQLFCLSVTEGVHGETDHIDCTTNAHGANTWKHFARMEKSYVQSGYEIDSRTISQNAHSVDDLVDTLRTRHDFYTLASSDEETVAQIRKAMSHLDTEAEEPAIQLPDMADRYGHMADGGAFA